MIMVDGDELARSAELVGAFAAQADVSKTDDVEHAASETIERTGRIDVVVNNARILQDRVVWKHTDDDWSQVLAVHSGAPSSFALLFPISVHETTDASST